MNDDLLTGTIGNMGLAYKDIISTRVIDESALWSNDSGMQELRNVVASQTTTRMDLELLEKLKSIMENPKKETKEDRVIGIVKRDFENHFDMTITEFQEIYETILKNNPEKLV